MFLNYFVYVELNIGYVFIHLGMKHTFSFFLKKALYAILLFMTTKLFKFFEFNTLSNKFINFDKNTHILYLKVRVI